MQRVFTDYPDVPWAPDWRFFSGPEDNAPLVSRPACGELSAPGETWTLQLIDSEKPFSVRLFSNGLFLHNRKKSTKQNVSALLLSPGILSGSFAGTKAPQLTAEKIRTVDSAVWTKTDTATVLLLVKSSRFVLICSDLSPEQALMKAEAVLDESPENLIHAEQEPRKNIINLFSINPRHNPPVALAAESLRARLRSRTASLHGLWSLAEGFETPTFSLNELYPLVKAWNIIDPSVSIELMQTALALQKSDGSLPAWMDADGLFSPAAPWPFIAQSFEKAWETTQDQALLQRHLPALRKYLQWVLRYFDPYRDNIPFWQVDSEVFVPNSFERGKATPELTTLLICEIEAVQRLLTKNNHTRGSNFSSMEERDRLANTLATVFWNPETRLFSNVWKEGHTLHEPSFGSFTPLLWDGLNDAYSSSLLVNFDETNGFPGEKSADSWDEELSGDTNQVPAIHQLIAFEALQKTNARRSQLMVCIRRAREGFSTWFERQAIRITRTISHNEPLPAPPYALGPVTAAQILIVQQEFRRQTEGKTTLGEKIARQFHNSRFDRTDMRIAAGSLAAIVIIHLAYNIPRSHNAEARISEAALNYQQRHFTEAMRISRRFPDHPLSQLIRGNLMVISGNPDKAEELYRNALLQETESPSALLGLALAQQMNGKFEEAAKRYNDFLDIYEETQPQAAELADEFLQLALERFSKPPRWQRIYALPLMNDLGL